jgi:hypothetical protein
MERDSSKEIDNEFFLNLEEILKGYISPIEKKLSWKLFTSICNILGKNGCWCDEMKPLHRYRVEEHFTIGYPLPM